MSSSYQPTPVSYGQPMGQRFNTLSIVAFVLAFVVSLGAIICGHIALAQIKRTGERGHALAIWALVLGYAGILFGLLTLIVSIAVAASVGTSGY